VNLIHGKRAPIFGLSKVVTGHTLAQELWP